MAKDLGSGIILCQGVKPSLHLGRTTKITTPNKDALAHERDQVKEAFDHSHGTLTPISIISAHKQGQKLTPKDPISCFGARGVTSFSHLGRSTNKDALAHEHGTPTPIIVISTHKQSQKFTSKDSMSTIGAQEAVLTLR